MHWKENAVEHAAMAGDVSSHPEVKITFIIAR